MLVTAATARAADYTGTATQDQPPVYGTGYVPFQCVDTDPITISVNGNQLAFTDGHGRKATATVGADGKFSGEYRDANVIFSVEGEVTGNTIRGSDKLAGRSVTCHKSFVATTK